MKKLNITLPTLESHNHFVGDIERGVKIYKQGKVEWKEQEDNFYLARVPHKGEFKTVSISFTRDGQDLEHHHCDCSWRYASKNKRPPICRHVVAATLAVQGEIPETGISLGKSATVNVVVNESNTASAMKSGTLPVFATPSLIALMEQAACECLADCLSEEQTSVGSSISIEHTAASPIGAEIKATATIDFVFGRKIEFNITARDNAGEVGKGKHTRFIVDSEKFTAKASKRLLEN